MQLSSVSSPLQCFFFPIAAFTDKLCFLFTLNSQLRGGKKHLLIDLKRFLYCLLACTTFSLELLFRSVLPTNCHLAANCPSAQIKGRKYIYTDIYTDAKYLNKHSILPKGQNSQVTKKKILSLAKSKVLLFRLSVLRSHKVSCVPLSVFWPSLSIQSHANIYWNLLTISTTTFLHFGFCISIRIKLQKL